MQFGLSAFRKLHCLTSWGIGTLVVSGALIIALSGTPGQQNTLAGLGGGLFLAGIVMMPFVGIYPPKANDTNSWLDAARAYTYCGRWHPRDEAPADVIEG